MKTINIALLVLSALSCASFKNPPKAPADKPTLAFDSVPRLVNVYQPFVLRAAWRGPLPAKDQYLMFVTSYLGGEQGPSVQRLNNGYTPVIIVKFTVEDYLEATGRIMGDGLRTYVMTEREAMDAYEDYSDSPNIPIELSVYEAKEAPDDPTGWVRGRKLVSGKVNVMVSCPYPI